MWLSKAAHSLYRVVYLISRSINSVAAGILIAMMFLTAADVLLRYIFNRPLTGALELTEFMMVSIVAFSAAYCVYLKGHVRVELVISRFSTRVQAVMNSITYLLSLGLFSLITWQGFLYIKAILNDKLTSAVLLVPIFPFVAILAFGFIVFVLMLLVDCIKFISQAVKQ